MGLRFHRSIRIAKGVRLNFSKRGIGISAGVKGFRAGVGPRGAYTSAGIPGTGLYSINYLGHRKKQAVQREKPVTAASQTTAPGLPLPGEIQNSGATAGWLLLIVSIVLLFIYWPVGLLGLAGLIFWQYRVAKSPAGQARKYFAEGNRALLKGDHEKAIAAFSKVLDYRQCPDLYPVLGDLYHAEEKHEDAVAAYRKAGELSPDAKALQYKQACSLISLDRYEEALPLLQSLPPEIKSLVQVINATALCFLGLKQPEPALDVLKNGPVRKKTMDEQMLLFRYLLGTAYRELGEKKKALNQFNKVYAVQADFADVKQMIAELSQPEQPANSPSNT